MGKRVIRALLVIGLLGALGVYVWHGLTAVRADEYDIPWANWAPLPIVAVTVFSIAWPMLGISGSIRFGSNSKAFRSAPIGIGTITAIRRTSLTVNDRPQLRIDLTVRTPDGESFDSVATQVFDLVELNGIALGAMVPVRYLPGRTDRVEIDRGRDEAQAQAAFNQVMIQTGLSSERSLDIASRGVGADAVVTATHPTGRIIRGNPEISITLNVNRPDGSSYETTVDKVIAAHLVGYVQVGRVVAVHYLPSDEDEVVLELPAAP